MPSQVSHPTAHPFENYAPAVGRTHDAVRWSREAMHGIRDTVSRQSGRTQKHDCPFCPLALPSLSGTGHQPVSVSTEGHLPATWQGTGPFHGAMSLSIALRGGGLTTWSSECGTVGAGTAMKEQAERADFFEQAEMQDAPRRVLRPRLGMWRGSRCASSSRGTVRPGTETAAAAAPSTPSRLSPVTWPSRSAWAD